MHFLIRTIFYLQQLGKLKFLNRRKYKRFYSRRRAPTRCSKKQCKVLRRVVHSGLSLGMSGLNIVTASTTYLAWNFYNPTMLFWFVMVMWKSYIYIYIYIYIIPGQFIKHRKWWFDPRHIKGALTFQRWWAETRVTSATLHLHVQAATDYTPSPS